MVALTLPAAVGLALVAKPLADIMVGPGLREGAAMVTPWIAASVPSVVYLLMSMSAFAWLVRYR